MLRNDIYRLIDANINRASEALRVLEDWARFVDDDKNISEKLKNARHKINNTFSEFSNLILSRESALDVGRDIKSPSKKSSIRDVIRANCKRLEESLRVLAEYGQVLDINVKELENLRYEIYTIEKELIKSEKLIRLNNSHLYLVTNRDGFNSDVDFLNVIEKSIRGGVDIIQLREKNEKEKKVLKLAKEIKKIVSGTKVLFIINDHVDIALSVDADGVHLGQDDLPLEAGRKIAPDGFIIGLSTHSIEQGREALKSCADYLGAGPVFATPTKPDYKPAGLEYVKWASENIKEIPFFAIGGIDERNIDKVINAGASRIAVVRAIMNAQDPFKVASQLKNKLTENIKIYANIK